MKVQVALIAGVLNIIMTAVNIALLLLGEMTLLSYAAHQKHARIIRSDAEQALIMPAEAHLTAIALQNMPAMFQQGREAAFLFLSAITATYKQAKLATTET